jgi:hypothetical protein
MEAKEPALGHKQTLLNVAKIANFANFETNTKQGKT